MTHETDSGLADDVGARMTPAARWSRVQDRGARFDEDTA
jgi:hypothetical protein